MKSAAPSGIDASGVSCPLNGVPLRQTRTHCPGNNAKFTVPLSVGGKVLVDDPAGIDTAPLNAAMLVVRVLLSKRAARVVPAGL